LIAAVMTTQADGRAERDAALLMLHELTRKRRSRITAGADKAYDTRDFVSTVRELGVTPHVARRQNGAIDERTSRHPGYAISLKETLVGGETFRMAEADRTPEEGETARAGEGGLVTSKPTPRSPPKSRPRSKRLGTRGSTVTAISATGLAATPALHRIQVTWT
jgi:hypothetical protein